MRRLAKRCGPFAAWPLTLLLLAGCATPHRVNEETLVRVFADLRRAPQKEPVIIIPGALGSLLQDTATGRLVWGGAGAAPVDRLALPMDGATLRENRDTIVATNLMARAVVVPGLLEFKVNEDLIRVLREAGGYGSGDLERPQPGDNCFLFWYDWRRDLVEAAQQLGTAIERLKARLGDPHLQVRLICHSAGGLVARYYVKYGTADVLDQTPLPAPTYAGARHVSQVIMLGTPNGGSLETFQSLHEGFEVPGPGRFTPATVFTMPSAYELLPHADETAFVNAQGQPLDVGLYDPAHWETYGWSVWSPAYQDRVHHEMLQRGTDGEARYQERLAQQRRFLGLALNRARRFHEALDGGNPADDPARYVLLGADCRPTLWRAVLTQDGGAWRTAFTADDPALRAALFGLGDGSVLKESLLGAHREGIGRQDLATSTVPVEYAVFVCEAHMWLTRNLTFLDNVLHALLAREAARQHAAVCLVCQRRLAERRTSAPAAPAP